MSVRSSDSPTSYRSAVLALSGLGAFWPLDEETGAARAIDLGPHRIDLVYRGGGKRSSRSLIAGLEQGYGGDGHRQCAVQATPCAAAPWASAATGFTYGAWVRPTAAPSAGTWLGGAGTWRLLLSAGLCLQAPVGIEGTSIIGAPYSGTWPTTPDVLAPGSTYLVIASWDGADLALWINGIKLTTVRSVGGTVPATPEPFQIFWDGNAVTGPADVAGAFVLDRGITAYEARHLYRCGTLVPPLVEAIDFDDQGGSTELVPASEPDAGCAACGGRMAEGEATIASASGTVFHPGCYAARQLAKKPPRGVAADTPASEMAGECCRLLWDMTTYFVRRPSAQHPVYLDPRTNLFLGFESPGRELPDDASDQYAMTGTGFAAIAARLALYGRAPSSSWLVTLATQVIDGFLAAQPLEPGRAPVGLETQMFFPVQLAETLLLLSPHLGEAKRRSWTQSLLVFMDDFYLRSYFPYYANANFEAQYLYLTWLTGRITGDPRWTAQFDAQYDWLVRPSSIEAPSARNNALGRGLVLTRRPTKADGSDGAGFLTESSNTPTTILSISAEHPAKVTVAAPIGGICPVLGDAGNTVVIEGAGGADGVWTPTPVSATKFTIPYDNRHGRYAGGATAVPVGYDPYYSLLQMSALSMLYAYSRDARVLTLLNLLCNQTLGRVDRRTWLLDATNGVRKSFTLTYATAAMQILGRLGGRHDLDPDALASQWNATYADIRAAMNGAEVPGGRDTNYIIGGMLLTAPDWPGLPS